MIINLIKYTLLLTVATVNYFLWKQSQAVVRMDMPIEKLKSVSWDPFHFKNYDPEKKNYISEAELETDIQKLSEFTSSVRVYRSTEGLDKVAPIAKKYGLNVIAGVTLTSDPQENKKEIDSVIDIVNNNDNVVRIIVGNEIILHNFISKTKTVTKNELYQLLEYVRAHTKVPVSTGEPFNLWLENPELVTHVDFIAIHVIPYWYGVPSWLAVDWVYERYQKIKKTFPNKEIMIAEVGWPSNGPRFGLAKPSLENQFNFMSALINDLRFDNIQYNFFEAFDQPWKINLHEGRVGAHWGMLTSDGYWKPTLQQSLLSTQGVHTWAVLSTFLFLLAGLYITFRNNKLKLRAYLFGYIVMQITISLVLLIIWTIMTEYMIGTIHMWIILPALFLFSVILISQLMETIDVIGRRPLKFDTKGASKKEIMLSEPYFVSIHVACRNEPPAMVIETIKSLLALDYPRYEIIIIDNNTTDERYWKPVKAFCNLQRDCVRFFTLQDHPGFKAGALNFAREQCNPQTEIIAVVDADYKVDPHWLSKTVPLFKESEVAVVQAPQAYRDWEGSLFQTMERDEYEGFFRIGMVQRNEHNALIQHGTMTMIRKTVMDQIGGWAEWCITEDTELGIRVLQQGYEVRYINAPYGHGLVPHTFKDFCSQRTRWVYGAIRMMIYYRHAILGWKDKSLTLKQRYHFITGWLPWLGDAMHPLFCILGAIMIYKMIGNSRYFPPFEFTYPLMVYAAFRVISVYLTYKARVGVSIKRRIWTMITGAALINTISLAVIRGFFTRHYGFYRTNKSISRSVMTSNLASFFRQHWEKGIALVLLGEAGWLLHRYGIGNMDALVWSMAAITLALPGLCAFFIDTVSFIEAKKRSRMMADVDDFELPLDVQNEIAQEGTEEVIM